jgi:hypothetical protein
MSWLCWHIGTTTDPKFGAVAKRCSNVTKHLVVAVWAHLLEQAFEATDKGSIEGIDTEDVAIALECEEDQVSAIIEAMAAKGLIEDGKIANWNKRQNSTSTERVKRFRDKKKADETPETVSPVSETHETRTDRQTDIQTNIEKKAGARAPDPDFENWWSVYPRKASKGQALKAYIAARKRGIGASELLAGAKRYAADPKRDDKFTKHAATWLNAECWLDEQPSKPAAVVTDPDAELKRAAWLVNGRHTNLSKVDDKTIVQLIQRGLTDEKRARAYGWVPSADFVAIASNARTA